MHTHTQTMSRAIEVGKVEHSAAELSPLRLWVFQFRCCSVFCSLLFCTVLLPSRGYGQNIFLANIFVLILLPGSLWAR